MISELDENDPRTFEIIGAALKVRRRLGHAFLEAVHQEALAVEFLSRHIPFQREVDLPIRRLQRSVEPERGSPQIAQRDAE